MAISIVCEHCGRKLRAKDEHEGRRVKCPVCRNELVIAGERARPHDVFISYSNPDKTTADAVCAALEAAGTRCWIAPRDILPGLEWSEGIIDAINDCRVMVLIFSSSSNESQQVRRELERALAKEVPILPFRIEAVPLSKSMEYFIGTQHWLDALTQPMERNLQRLTDTVDRLLAKQGAGVPHSAPPPIPETPPAVEPAAPSSAAVRIKRLPLFVAAALVGSLLAAALAGLLLVAVLPALWPSKPPPANPDSDDELSQAGWQSLFNGRDLTGWTQVRDAGKGFKLTSGDWSVNDGNIVRTTDTAGVLVAAGDYSDFLLALEFQLPEGAVFIAVCRYYLDIKQGEESVEIPLMRLALFQEPIESGGKALAPDLFVKRAITDIAEAIRPAGEWNSFELRCEGDQIQLTLNGTLVAEGLLSEIYGNVPKSGTLALANPEGKAKGTAFRNIRIRKLE